MIQETMPLSPKRPCTQPGCGALSSTGRCDRHPRPVRPGNWTRTQNTADKTGTRQATYGSERWRKARATFLKRNPLCWCGQPATDVDHIIPHDGTPDTFWDSDNWQAICHQHHLSKTAREARAKR